MDHPEHVIKLSEAREILAHGENNLGYPLVRKVQDGNMVYYVADPDEMTCYRTMRVKEDTA